MNTSLSVGGTPLRYFEVVDKPAGANFQTGAGAADGVATAEAIGASIAAGAGLSEGIATAESVGALGGAAPESPTGGWATWFRYEQEFQRRKRERERLEDAVEDEIAALLQGEDAPPAEEAAPEYVDALRDFVAEAQADADFRRFVEALALRSTMDELARLLAIDRAIRSRLAQQEEDEFIALLLMAA